MLRFFIGGGVISLNGKCAFGWWVVSGMLFIWFLVILDSFERVFLLVGELRGLPYILYTPRPFERVQTGGALSALLPRCPLHSTLPLCCFWVYFAHTAVFLANSL